MGIKIIHSQRYNTFVLLIRDESMRKLMSFTSVMCLWSYFRHERLCMVSVSIQPSRDIR